MLLLAENPATTANPDRALRVELPAGLIGLKKLRHFEVAPVVNGWPFVSFRALSDEEWNFLVLEPAGVIPGYAVELTDEDADALELERAEDAYIFNIVTVHSASPQYATANLVGPIVVNRHTLIGRQIIIANPDRYSTHYTLADERAAASAA